MIQDRTAPVLIKTKRVAMLMLLYTAYSAGHRLWHIGFRVTGKPNLIYPFNSFLPHWVAFGLNLFTYGMIAIILVQILRHVRGPERPLLAVWAGEALVVPLKGYATSPVAIGIVWAQAFGALVMFFAALQLYLSFRVMNGLSEPAPNE
jgi:hypothetical protein